MKTCYVDRPTRSILDLDKEQRGPLGWTISRISVLPPHRRQGIATRLLRECLADADAGGLILFLEPIPGADSWQSDEEFEQVRDRLIRWYEKHGFVPYPREPGFTWWRKPVRLHNVPKSHCCFKRVVMVKGELVCIACGQGVLVPIR